MAVWLGPNHGTKFSDVGTVFQNSCLRTAFMAEFIAVNNSHKSCTK